MIQKVTNFEKIYIPVMVRAVHLDIVFSVFQFPSLDLKGSATLCGHIFLTWEQSVVLKLQMQYSLNFFPSKDLEEFQVLREDWF